MQPRVALVTALKREVAPLLRSFAELADTPFPCFGQGGTWVACSGVGGDHAAEATRWLIARVKPEVVMSIGFAGALVVHRRVGDIITPASVVDADTGDVFPVTFGSGLLVSASEVVGADAKRRLATSYKADAVDMEAASVARVAQENGTSFFAVKAISDAVDFSMPPMQRFVSEKGKFQTSELLAYAAVRPGLWPALMQLGSNAKAASSQLCRWIENQMNRDFQDVLDVCGRARS